MEGQASYAFSRWAEKGGMVFYSDNDARLQFKTIGSETEKVSISLSEVISLRLSTRQSEIEVNGLKYVPFKPHYKLSVYVTDLAKEYSANICHLQYMFDSGAWRTRIVLSHDEDMERFTLRKLRELEVVL